MARRRKTVSKKTRRKKADNRLLNKFIRIFIVSFAIMLLGTGVFTAGYVFISKNSFADQITGKGKNKVEKEEKTRTTFAVFGVDKDGFRTDVTMLVFFDHKTAELDVLSIPRDTKIDIPDDIYVEMATRRNVPRTIKINEVPTYSDPEKRNETSVAVLEELFDVDIDYFFNMDIGGFKYIVDLIGGVEMEIPFNMVYNDPYQDLHINLRAGQQTLNGDQAEQLVRYRKGYANGDLGRLDMQHEFMVAFMKQLLTPKNKINKVNIASAAILYMTTDFTDSMDYLDYVDKLSINKINISTIPGENEYTDRSYFIYDEDEVKDYIQAIINNEDSDSKQADEEEEEEEIDAKALKISVQNGTNISGFASSTKDKLENSGYTVIEAINYKDKPVDKTMLIVPTKKVGEEISEYFNNPEIVVDDSKLSEEKEVIIVLGDSDEV